jgi:hypothetical protein
MVALRQLILLDVTYVVNSAGQVKAFGMQKILVSSIPQERLLRDFKGLRIQKDIINSESLVVNQPSEDNIC